MYSVKVRDEEFEMQVIDDLDVYDDECGFPVKTMITRNGKPFYQRTKKLQEFDFVWFMRFCILSVFVQKPRDRFEAMKLWDMHKDAIYSKTMDSNVAA